MKRFMIARCLLIVVSLVVLIPVFSVCAQDLAEKTLLTEGPLQKVSDYFSTQTLVYSDGTSITRDEILGDVVANVALLFSPAPEAR